MATTNGKFIHLENQGSEAMQRAGRLIALERARQDARWGEQNHEAPIWSLIATEELGEVSQAALEILFKSNPSSDRMHSREAYITELTQLAAVCVAWLECELRRDGDR